MKITVLADGKPIARFTLPPEKVGHLTLYDRAGHVVDSTPLVPKRRHYGQWAGDPQGMDERLDLCVAEVWSRFRGWQCQRRRGYGPHEELCKQHARMLEEGHYVCIPKEEKQP